MPIFKRLTVIIGFILYTAVTCGGLSGSKIETKAAETMIKLKSIESIDQDFYLYSICATANQLVDVYCKITDKSGNILDSCSDSWAFNPSNHSMTFMGDTTLLTDVVGQDGEVLFYTYLLPKGEHSPVLAKTPVYKIKLQGKLIQGYEEYTEKEEEDSNHSKKKRSDSAAEYDYRETENGIFYGGMQEDCFVTTTMIPAEAYSKFGNFLAKKISAVQGNSEIKVNCEPWTSLPKNAIEAVGEKVSVPMTFIYTLDGKRYVFTIPTGTDATELTDENGYSGLAYLGGKFGCVPYNE